MCKCPAQLVTLCSLRGHAAPACLLLILAGGAILTSNACASIAMQELLPAMKLVKYYAWERFFEDEVRRWCNARSSRLDM